MIDYIFRGDVLHPRTSRPWREIRRLRALAYAGYGETSIADRTGLDPRQVHELMTGATAAPVTIFGLIDTAYQRYAHVVGPNQDTADAARLARWASVGWWSEYNIDCLEAPVGSIVVYRTPDQAHHAVISAALAGAVRAIELTVPERITVVRHLADRLVSDRGIGERLRWAHTLTESERAVAAFRCAHDIHSRGNHAPAGLAA